MPLHSITEKINAHPNVNKFCWEIPVEASIDDSALRAVLQISGNLKDVQQVAVMATRPFLNTTEPARTTDRYRKVTIVRV